MEIKTKYNTKQKVLILNSDRELVEKTITTIRVVSDGNWKDTIEYSFVDSDLKRYEIEVWDSIESYVAHLFHKLGKDNIDYNKLMRALA